MTKLLKPIPVSVAAADRAARQQTRLTGRAIDQQLS
ncbi:hypothetical protein BJ973_005219 [Actinoplanes tereljensis]